MSLGLKKNGQFGTDQSIPSGYGNPGLGKIPHLGTMPHINLGNGMAVIEKAFQPFSRQVDSQAIVGELSKGQGELNKVPQ